MTPSPFSAQQVEQIKKQAKRIAKQQGLQHSHALDLVAKKHGFGNWSQLVRGAPVAPPTKRAMRKWFAANHAPAAEVSPYNGREGGYLYPTVDVWESLEKAFPNADPGHLDDVAKEFDAEGPYVERTLLEGLENNLENAPLVMQGPSWIPPLKKGRYRSAEVPAIDIAQRLIKVECVRYRYRAIITDNEPGHLIFRCPVCNKVHLHGGGGLKLGAGDGTRVPHCRVPTESFQFDLVEVLDPARAGHLPQKYLKHLKIPTI